MRPPDAQTNPAPAQNPAPSPWPVCGLLGLAVFVVFWPALHCGFIDFDDPDYVAQNAHVLGGLTPANISWAFHSLFLGFWQPVTWLSYMLDASLYGSGPAGFHFTNVLLHAVNSALVFLLLRRLTSAFWRSAIVAALFALHPLRVESVAWVTERKDVLSTCFGLLAMWCYIAWQRANTPSGSGQTGKGQKLYFAALGSFALGLMSKPMLVTLPCVLLLLDWWPLKRRQDWRRLLVEKIPFFTLSAASAAVTLLAHSEAKGVYSLAALPLSLRLENAVVSYARYLGKTFWPVDLAVLYPHPGHWPGLTVWAAVALFGMLTLAVWVLRNRAPFLPMGWLWFTGMLLPVSGLMQAGSQAMADRFTYLPSVGLLVGLVWGAAELLRRAARLRPVTGLLVAGLLLACSLRTRDQLRYWKDSGTIFAHAAAVTERNFVASDNLGGWLLKQHRTDDALAQFRRALEFNPDYAQSLNNVGMVLANRQSRAEAEPYFRRALAVDPTLVEAMNNLGNALLETNPTEATQWLAQAVRQQPDYAAARYNLGMAFEKLGHNDEAIAAYKEAVRLEPDNAEGLNNLANALARAGRLSDAVASFEAALKLQPHDAKLHSNLGGVLSLQGRLDEAIAQYTEALRLRPDHAGAHNNLGLALLRRGRGADAATEFTEAIRLKPDLAIAHCNLGRALAQLHRETEAAAEYQIALRLDPALDEARRQLQALPSVTAP